MMPLNSPGGSTGSGGAGRVILCYVFGDDVIVTAGLMSEWSE